MQIQALEETIDKWEDIAPGETHTNPEYAAMMEDLDTGIGMVLDKLEELGVMDKTYVVFTSDHGQAIYASRNEPLSWGKGSLWEGGMRVPLIVSGPGIEAGTASDVRTVSLDFFPTFAELAGVADTLPGDLDGGSLLPVLYNEGAGDIERDRDELIFHFGQPSGQPNSVAASSVYLDEYKLLKFYDTGELHLYDVYADPAEQNNLADSLPAKVDELHDILTQYLDEVDARIPDPSRARGQERRRGGPGAGG
jgi:arylsulfatase A-like enzyme